MKYIFLAVLAIILIGIVICILIIKNKLRHISITAFGTDSLIEGYKNTKQALSETPKSVSGMTSIYLPMIIKDFPEFNYEEFKTKAEIMLKSAFSAITQNDISLLENASTDLTSETQLIINNNISQNQNEVYNDVQLYATEITKYQKMNGTCSITLQSSVGHYHYITQDEKIISGDKELREQCKYNIQLLYVQDISKVSAGEFKTALGTNCPNCGAPVTTLGLKYCEYCGSKLETININVWSINKYTKL